MNSNKSKYYSAIATVIAMNSPSMIDFNSFSVGKLDRPYCDTESRKIIKKYGQNGKCPCNSGKKVKNCCGQDKDEQM